METDSTPDPADGPRRPGRTAPKPSARGRLSRPLVLRAAVALVDREGLAALTMRSLAVDLDVEPMALYRYADGKQALLDGMVEAFYAEVNERIQAVSTGPARPVDGPGGDWRARLQHVARAFHQAADAHPAIFPLVATRPLSLPLARRPASMLQLNELVLTLLHQAGLDDRATLRLYRTVVGWAIGYLLVDKRQVIDNPDDPEPLLRLGLHRLPAAQYPLLRTLAPLLMDHDAETEFATGLDVLLDRLGH
ncbi:TetR/AcrR family transcriptional regulator C-terminal domain-containing protein [Kitasatospora sp. NPDC096128]|uniref:TetR/AcrR family transcriptional regulator n=1 Tax=Kitasatospora sp. NPDC096128 TaxID=3155547 RepID=UPI00332DEBAD